MPSPNTIFQENFKRTPKRMMKHFGINPGAWTLGIQWLLKIGYFKKTPRMKTASTIVPPGRLERTHYSKWVAVERRNTHFLNKASLIMVYRFFSNGPTCRTPQKPLSHHIIQFTWICDKKKCKQLECIFTFKTA